MPFFIDIKFKTISLSKSLSIYKLKVMIDPKDEDYSNDPNDALRREDDTEDINELPGDDPSIDYGKDKLDQADEASRPSYELNVDDIEDEEGLDD